MNRSTYHDSNGAAETTRSIIEQLFGKAARSGFAVRLWNGDQIPVEKGPQTKCTLVLNHPGALYRMFWPPGELTLAEAYLSGDFNIEGDIFSFWDLAASIEPLPPGEWFRAARMARALPRAAMEDSFIEGRQRAHLGGARHSRARDRAAISYHYDVGNDFFRLFLGRWMAYSCAYFRDPECDLDDAQEAKLEHICRKLRLKPGERLLDIGCGWGGLVLYAARRHRVRAVGVTLSQPQAKYGQHWIREMGLEDSAQIKLLDYRDLDALGPFDKAVSVGMFEHVGREKLAEYFESAWKALKPGGLFLNHGIAEQGRKKPGWLARTLLQRGEFIQRYVFPDGELVPISEALTVAEQTGFEVRDVESLREHYALTLRHWVHNLEEMYERVLQVTDERTFRTWRMYLSAFCYGFETGQYSLFQALLAKHRDGDACLPLTRADLYRPA